MAMASSLKNQEMASENPFLGVQISIHKTFEYLMTKLIRRKDELLEMLGVWETNYYSSKAGNEQQMKYLDEMIQNTTKVNLKSVQREKMEKNYTRLKDLMKIIITPICQFDTTGLQELQKHIETFGNVHDAKDIYKRKLQPFQSIGKKGEGKEELYGPRGITTDGKGNLYIADVRNRRIQVMSLDGTYVTEFGNKELGKEKLASPHTIAIGETCVIVSDRINKTVLKYDICNYNCQCISEENFDLPLGITVDGDNVFVADCGKNRVAILNIGDLKFNEQIVNEILKEPLDVKVNNDDVIVADKYNIHFFSKLGELRKIMIKFDEGINSVFLSIDNLGNILVSDGTKKITIFTTEGNLLHSIETDYKPSGIAVTPDNTIICADYSNNKINLY